MIIIVVRQRLCNRCTFITLNLSPSGNSHVGLLFANDDHKKLAQDLTATEALYGYICCNTKNNNNKNTKKQQQPCGCTQALFARNQKTKNSPTCIPFTCTTARLRSDVEH